MGFDGMNFCSDEFWCILKNDVLDQIIIGTWAMHCALCVYSRSLKLKEGISEAYGMNQKTAKILLKVDFSIFHRKFYT